MFYHISLKPFRILYRFFAVLYLIMLIAAYFTVSSKLYYNINLVYSNRFLPQIFVLITAIFSVIIINILRRKKKRLQQEKVFEKKVQLYLQYYKQKLIWNFIVGSLTCLLYCMSGKIAFLYLSVMYLFFVISFFPGKNIMRRDLGKTDIEFT